MRALAFAGFVLALGCGRVEDAAVDASPDGGVDTAPGETPPVPGCRGALSGPCLEDGKECLYVDKCVLWSDSTTAVKCLRKAFGSPLEWVIMGGKDCYRVNDPLGCPYGGALPGEYCETVGQVCEYPRACIKTKSVYQVAKCVTGDAGAPVWVGLDSKTCPP